MDNKRPDKPIVFFDGECVLCSFLADWLVHRAQDPKDPRVFIASLQGTTAKDLGVGSTDPNTVVFWQNNKAFCKTEAIVLLLIEANPKLRFLQIILFLPQKWCDKLYDLIANFRFKLFGKRTTCRVPTELEKSYFLP